jgi:hypothetical protein
MIYFSALFSVRDRGQRVRMTENRRDARGENSDIDNKKSKKLVTILFTCLVVVNVA